MNRNDDVLKSSETDTRRLYNDLSWTWPIISPPEDYLEEGRFYTEKIRTRARREGRSLLHLGCGGGHMDWAMKNNFRIRSIDISPHMLALAEKLNPEVTYSLGDMRTVRLDEKFDAVLIHDAINYMLTVDDLRAAFRTAFEHLKDDGLMITSAEQWPENFVQHKIRPQTEKKDDIEITFIEHFYDPDPNDTHYECTFIYLIRRGGKLQVEFDRHLAGIFPLESWRKTIMEVGFILEETEFTHSDFAENDSYPMFIGIKPSTATPKVISGK